MLIGNRELIIRMSDPKGGEVKEGKFRITRMRCWRIMAPEASALAALPTSSTSCASCSPALELSFEYLMPSGSKVSAPMELKAAAASFGFLTPGGALCCGLKNGFVPQRSYSLQISP